MKQPIVVKLGTSLVVGPGGKVRRAVLRERAREVATLVRGGDPVCVVSSGAIALGQPRLGLEQRPRAMPRLQAASALGQARLQAAWNHALGLEGIPAAQVLLTADKIADRTAYVNAQNALSTLFGLHTVPIVNENDATATDEITFGDNDALAAQVAVLVRARLLVLLTEVEGVLTRAPGRPGAELIADGSAIEEASLGEATGVGKGGIRSKVVAARMAGAAGIPTVIAAGAGKDVLAPIVAGQSGGTCFVASERSMPAWKLWIRFGKPAKARLTVDEGARRTIAEDGKSLLAVGVDISSAACAGYTPTAGATESARLNGRLQKYTRQKGPGPGSGDGSRGSHGRSILARPSWLGSRSCGKT